MNNLRDILRPFSRMFYGSKIKRKIITKEEIEILKGYNQINMNDIIKDNVKWFANHSKLYSNQSVYFQISINNIKSLKMTLDEIIELKEKFNEVATGIFGLYFDNSAELILSDCFGYLFKFSIHKLNDTYEFRLWDDTGANHLFSFATKNNLLSKEEIEEVEKIMYNYIKGIINCSDCKKEICSNDIAGRYFAGRYCKDCWEGKWKAIEAKETYD